jgi:hypothetical protein
MATNAKAVMKIRSRFCHHTNYIVYGAVTSVERESSTSVIIRVQNIRPTNRFRVVGSDQHPTLPSGVTLEKLLMLCDKIYREKEHQQPYYRMQNDAVQVFAPLAVWLIVELFLSLA